MLHLPHLLVATYALCTVKMVAGTERAINIKIIDNSAMYWECGICSAVQYYMLACSEALLTWSLVIREERGDSVAREGERGGREMTTTRSTASLFQH